MAKAKKEYTRLTRNVGGFGTYSSLWLGADHVMIVASTGYTDTYVRLQFGDIKAIFVMPTNRRTWWGLSWGAMAFVSGLVLLSAVLNRETPIFSAIFFALGLIGLGWNQWLGAGCCAYVVTGVQTAKLPSLVRIKKTSRVLARLEPLIAAAQTHLPPAGPEPFRVPPPLGAAPVEVPAPPPVDAAPGQPPAAS